MSNTIMHEETARLIDGRWFRGHFLQAKINDIPCHFKNLKYQENVHAPKKELYESLISNSKITPENNSEEVSKLKKQIERATFKYESTKKS